MKPSTTKTFSDNMSSRIFVAFHFPGFCGVCLKPFRRDARTGQDASRVGHHGQGTRESGAGGERAFRCPRLGKKDLAVCGVEEISGKKVLDGFDFCLSQPHKLCVHVYIIELQKV